MKILHIANGFSNSKVHSNLYKELDKLGVKQIVFNPVRTNRRIDIGKNEFDGTNTAFVYADVVKPIHHFIFHTKRRCVYNALLERVNVSEISLVHAATLMSDGGVAYNLFHDYQIPYVVSVRNTDINGFLDKMPHTWYDAKIILLNAERIFFISQGLKEKFEKHIVIQPILDRIKSKFVLMPNGIDDYYLSNIQSTPRTGHKIIYIGDFSNNKNLIRLCKAVLLLKKEKGLEDVSLTIVGGGNNRGNKVKLMIDSNPDVINYVGKIFDKERLCALLCEHRVFAMPSINETFGLVYLEALSQNLPVLFTKGQGIDGLFDETVGVGVNPFSVNDIANALKRLLFNSKQYSNNCVDFSAFRWSSIAEKYREHYRYLLGYDNVNKKLLTDFKRVERKGE